jgi:glutamate synthase domain-containing protein 3
LGKQVGMSGGVAYVFDEKTIRKWFIIWKVELETLEDGI